MKNVKVQRKNWLQKWLSNARSRFLTLIGAEEAWALQAAYNAMPKIVELSQNPDNVLIFSRSTLHGKDHIGKDIYVFGEDIQVSGCGFIDGEIIVDACSRRALISNNHFVGSPSAAAIQIYGV